MGGTSTDVSRFGGSFEHVFETTTAGISIQSPQLDINTVAAGGGSMLFWSNGLFKVGPEVSSTIQCWDLSADFFEQSAGAHPGPAAYRKGGPLTVTDANLFLGRLLPEFFPSIFGPEENLPLYTDIAAAKFEELTQTINAESGRSMTPREVAHGFLDVANESMCRPIRAITEARGFETGQHHLAVFGGAGGQHACDIAAKLGIQRVIIHKYSSILSAYGMSLAEVVQEEQVPCSETLSDDILPRLQERMSVLKTRVTDALLKQGIPETSIEYEPFLNLRYHGTSTNFMIQEPEDRDWRTLLEATHLRELAFSFPREHKVLVDDVRVRGIGKTKNTAVDAEEFAREMASTDFSEIKVACEQTVRYCVNHSSQLLSITAGACFLLWCS